jgi:crossover junction endodeoxyribonuclease RuvC
VSALVTIGIDPGISGGIAFVGEAGELQGLADLPVMRDGKLSWIDGGCLQSMLIDTLGGKQAHVIIERVGAMPKQGVSSSFHFGMTFGSILSILQARHLPIELVSPAKWKREMGLIRDPGKPITTYKRQSIDKARMLYPAAELSLSKHEGRAEALLLAHWARCRRGT